MTREGHVRFCEGLEVKSLRPTHPGEWWAQGGMFVKVTIPFLISEELSLS